MSTVITKDDANRAFCENLAHFLQTSGMSQGELARRLFGAEIGMADRMRISRLCNGQVIPTPADLANLAEIMECTVDSLLRPRKKSLKKVP